MSTTASVTAAVSVTFEPSPTPTGRPTAPLGYGSARFTWGVPAGKGAKSGYTFQGGTAHLPLDGAEFTLGTLSHANRPLKKPQALNVELTVRLALDVGTEGVFTYRLRHRPASGSAGSPTSTADTVEVSVATTTGTVTLDGDPYTMVITGFAAPDGGPPATSFASPDRATRTVRVTARLVATGTPDVRITHVEHRGKIKRTQSDEYAEITNQGTASAHLEGWTLNAGDSDQDYTFPPGTLLKPGTSLRVYTHEIHPETGGHSFGSKTALWNDGGDTGVLRDQSGALVSQAGYGTGG